MARILEKSIFNVHHDGMNGTANTGTVETFEDINHEPTTKGPFLVFEIEGGKRYIHQDRVHSITVKYIWKEQPND